MAQRAGLSKSALGRLLAELEANGYVAVEADRRRGTKINLRAA